MLIILISLLWTVCPKVLNTKFLGDTKQLSLMIGQFQTFTVHLPFQTYSSIKLNFDSPDEQHICYLNDAALEIQQLQFIPKQQNRKSPDVITSYDYLLQKTHLIDMMILQTNLYLLFSNGVFIIKYENQKLGPGISPLIKSKFQAGKFVILNNQMYLVTNNSLYKIQNSTNYIQLKGYSKINKFISAIPFNNKSIIVLDQSSGIIIYQISETIAILQYSFNKQFFGWETSFVDIIKYQNSLLILDNKIGIVNLTIKEQQFNQSTFQIIQNISSNCEKMEIYEELLYIACSELNSVNLSNLQRDVFEHPRFRIKNIAILDKRPIIAGNNLIKIYQQGFQINSDLNFGIGKIIVDKDMILIGDRPGVKLLKWNLTQPLITCGLVRNDTSSFPSSISVMIDITAQCNLFYIQSKLIDEQPQQGDTCIYHFPVDITFWQGKQFSLSPLKIILFVWIGLFVFLFLMWLVYKTKIFNLKRFLKKYKLIEQDSSLSVATKNYQNFEDEKDKQKQSDRSKTVQQQLHDIGD